VGGPWLIGPSSLVVIGLGIWLVLLEEWAAFSQLWIWLSLVLVAVSTAQGIYSGSESKRISRLADERGAEDGEVRDRLSRLLWLARIDMLILGCRPLAHGVQVRHLTRPSGRHSRTLAYPRPVPRRVHGVPTRRGGGGFGSRYGHDRPGRWVKATTHGELACCKRQGEYRSVENRGERALKDVPDRLNLWQVLSA
jgi:hypothetical protein